MDMKALSDSLSKCITTYLQPCVPGPTLEAVLGVVANHDLYPRDLAPAVWKNPAYIQFILRVDFLQTKINESGSLNVDGEITPQPLNADLSIKLADVELAAVQPYIAQRTSMTLLSGALSGDTKMHYGPGKPAIDFSGNLSVAKLHTVDNALHDDFVNWDRLDVQGLKYQQATDRLEIEQVSAQKMYARVMIEPDSTLNVTRVLAGPGATVVAPASPGTNQARISATAAAAAAPAAPVNLRLWRLRSRDLFSPPARQPPRPSR